MRESRPIKGRIMSEWISTDDRLPEINRSVLLLIIYQKFDEGTNVESEEICVGGRVGDGDDWFIGNTRIMWDYGYNLQFTSDDVTHWMPLPDLPK